MAAFFLFFFYSFFFFFFFFFGRCRILGVASPLPTSRSSSTRATQVCDILDLCLRGAKVWLAFLCHWCILCGFHFIVVFVYLLTVPCVLRWPCVIDRTSESSYCLSSNCQRGFWLWLFGGKNNKKCIFFPLQISDLVSAWIIMILT